MANPNKHITPPLLIPMEFCSPKRAAEMLGITIDDLWHFCYRGYLPLYVQLNGHKIQDSFEDVCASHWRDVCNDMRASRVTITKGFDALLMDYKTHIQISGIWQVFNSDISSPIEKHAPFTIGELSLIAEDKEDSDRYLCAVINKGTINHTVPFILFYDDLKEIHGAIYHNEELKQKNLPFYLDEANEVMDGQNSLAPLFKKATPRKPRTQAEHLALIEALIKSHPHINTELLKQPAKLHKTLGEMFARQGIHYPIESSRTYGRWFKLPDDS